MTKTYFTPKSFDFLAKLKKNNNRDWFHEHKEEYESLIRTPALTLIADMSGDLAEISPHFFAIPKKVGGSLMRVHRDVRFGKDKTPYKTHVGIHFRHAMGKDIHAPGFYLHIEKDACFAGVGIWRPDSSALGKIREGMSHNEKKWCAASQDKKFITQFHLSGDTLKNAPRGYSKEHPLLEDLKRKDFIAIASITDKTICSNRLRTHVIEKFKTGEPFMKFLCRSLELNY